ncbi:hypothetical protein E4U43_003300 [Claviceps pusilla]|uniref:Uncharacterized protein n=1 Tax=Claviceps pusilla TaxID=123648 RepID=A0A9P7SXN8_9HYPO|nr:hypothetical protein E4U43_003300 [Claviceps pusilla]
MPETSQHHHPHLRQQQQQEEVSASEADDGMPQSPRDHTVPVEIASAEAVSPVSQDRTYPDWTFLQPDSPEGVCELEGSPAYTTEQHLPLPSSLNPPPPPPLAVSPASDYPPDKKEMF